MFAVATVNMALQPVQAVQPVQPVQAAASAKDPEFVELQAHMNDQLHAGFSQQA